MREDNNTIAERIVKDGDGMTRALILTNDRFFMQEVYRRKDQESTSYTEILARPPILKKIISVEGKDLLVVSYGKVVITGNVEEIIKTISKIGGVISKDYRTAVSAILEAQRANIKEETAFPCVGIFTDPNTGQLAIATPQRNNIYQTEAKENGEANKITSEIQKCFLPIYGNDLGTPLTGYISIGSFVKPLEFVPVFGYAVASSLSYELKGVETQDYFCQLMLNGPKETGKSTTANLATQDLFGILPKGIDALDSPFKMLQVLNATSLMQHIAEVETFDFDVYADTIKNGTDIRNVGVRGNADQTINNYYGKSPIIYSTNGYKASKPSLLARMIIIPDQTDSDDIKKRAHLFSKLIRERTKKAPIGYELLRHMIKRSYSANKTIEEIDKEINEIRNELQYNLAKPEIAIQVTDSRRTLTYALMLFGVRQWRNFIHSLYPKLAETRHAEYWFNKYSNTDLFIEDIIRPLENVSKDTMRQNPTAAFIAWLESYISNQGEKEEGYTWMHAKKGGDYIYVTAGILQKHAIHCKQSGGTPFESLTHLATELKAHTGELCNVNSILIGRDEQRDPNNDRIVKAAVDYKGRKAVRVPMGDQTKLTAVVQTA